MRANAKQHLAALLLGFGSQSLNRRTAAFLFDRGESWQPTELAKRRHLLRLLQARGHTRFIEAGTYRGDTVDFLRAHAGSIVSVELDDRLYADAATRFAGAPSVRIQHGDALVEVPRAVAESNDPALVYLDGHFSGGTTALGTSVEPAPEILDALASVAPSGTTIVVDDLRLFGAQLGYPSLDALVGGARRAFPDATIRVGLDSLVIEV